MSSGVEVRDIGNFTQLFVDDYLIQRSSNLERKMHTAQRHQANPLIVPEFPFEMKYKYHYTWDNGSVIYDENQDIYRAYFSQAQKNLLYAESDDGIAWRKPLLNRVSYAGTSKNNILIEDLTACTVTFDPEKRMPYRMYAIKRGTGPFLLRSGDGLNWEGTPAQFKNPPRGDSAACIFDPVQKKYIGVFKARYPIGKIIQNPLTAEDWDIPVRVLGLMATEGSNFHTWTPWQEVLRPDEEDHQIVADRYPAVFVEGFLYPWRMKPEFSDAHAYAEETGFLDRLTVPPQKGYHHCDFMNMIIIPYHNLYIGLLEVLYSTAQVIDFGAKGSPRPDSPGQDGTMDVQLVCSRDLKNWKRLGSREPFIPLGSLTEWDQSMIMPFTSNNIVHNERLRIYYGGSRHSHRPNSMWNKPEDYPEELQGLGLATLRRDGFVSLEAGQPGGELTTKPLRFDGSHLVVNVDVKGGSLEVEVLDSKGEVLPGFESKSCIAFSGDKTEHTVTWENRADLSELREHPICLRFHIANGNLYSFAVR